MLPVIDYGNYAIVIPHVSIVGEIVQEDDRYGFKVFMSGKKDPVIIGYYEKDEAYNTRDELIAIVAQYYYIREFGPDFDMEDLLEDFEEECEEDENLNKKSEH